MFAQMPVCVYRHFKGAVCTTSSDDRVAAFSLASGLSKSSDNGALPDISEPPPVQRTQFKTFCRELRLQSQESFGRMARLRAAVEPNARLCVAVAQVVKV
jgi:hypothetical protein